MKTAAVVIPPLKDFYFTYHRFSSLGSEIVKKVLENHNIKVYCFNFPVIKKKNIPIPEELDYLKPYIIQNETGHLSFFTSYKYYGPDPGDSVSPVLNINPDMIFLSCYSFCYADEAVSFAQALKEKKDVCITAGGAGVSVNPEYFFKDNAVDFCITGEAEVSLPAFLKEFSGNRNFKEVPNLIYKKNKEFIYSEIKKYTGKHNSAIILKKTYETKKVLYYSTILSRGCPKECSFCTNHLSQGKNFRTVPYKKIEHELKKLKKPDKLKQYLINFEDDNILFDKEYFIKIIRLFKKYFKNPSFLLENGIDYSLLDNDLLKILIKLGLKKINFSIASSDENILKNEKRKLDLPGYETLLRTAENFNIPVTTYFICGLKNDTRESVANTLAYLFNLPTELGISLFYAVPGLKNLSEKSSFKSPCLCAGSSAYPWNNSLSTSSMVTAFRLSRFINCFKMNNKKYFPIIKKIMQEKTLYTFIKENGQLKIIPVKNLDTALVKLFFKKIS